MGDPDIFDRFVCVGDFVQDVVLAHVVGAEVVELPPELAAAIDTVGQSTHSHRSGQGCINVQQLVVHLVLDQLLLYLET